MQLMVPVKQPAYLRRLVAMETLLVLLGLLGLLGTGACYRVSGTEDLELPPDFFVGLGTSAFQVEGAWNESGKGESIWDRYLHQPSYQNGDVASDFYHKYKDDIALLSELKVKVFRFSLSWPRLLPTGKLDVVNPDGIRFYNDVINELQARNIEPLVTLLHFDVPQAIEDEGGWLNPKIIEYFEDYARFAFKTFGDRVRLWKTLNEPYIACTLGYGLGIFPPAYNMSGTGDYLCGHHQILAHVAAYRVYQSEFRHQGGSVGITLNAEPGSPKNASSSADKLAAQRLMEFEMAWFLDPLVYGDYPASMRAAAGDRLPTFTEQQKSDLKGTIDFVAMDIYTSRLTTLGVSRSVANPSFLRDLNVTVSNDPSWPTSATPIFPFAQGALRLGINWISKRYNNLPVILAETGWAGFPNETLDDQHRIAFLSNSFREMVEAVKEDGCRVLGLVAWSFMDSLEFTSGFSLKFGVVHVNFSDPTLPRTFKSSAYFMKDVATTRRVPYVPWPTNSAAQTRTNAT